MFSVNRLVGRTVEREITATCEITAAPALGSVSKPSYPLVPAPPGPPVPVQPDKFNLACLVKTQSTASDERRISHHASTRGSTVTSTPGSPDRSTCLERDEAGTGPARRGGRVAYGLVRTKSARDDRPGTPESSGSTATLESRSCIMRDVHANPPRDISFSDACG